MPSPDAGRQRWGRPSLTAALRELTNQSVDYARHRRGISDDVTLTYRRRGDVASGEWWTLGWVDEDGKERIVQSQYLGALLRRAAEALDADEAAEGRDPALDEWQRAGEVADRRLHASFIAGVRQAVAKAQRDGTGSWLSVDGIWQKYALGQTTAGEESRS